MFREDNLILHPTHATEVDKSYVMTRVYHVAIKRSQVGAVIYYSQREILMSLDNSDD